jgi:curved DNA-binding protein CbpA
LRGAALDPAAAARLLGVPLGATEKEIRAAYLRGIRENPPDRAPEAFERVRDAYEVLRGGGRLAFLFAGDPGAPLVRLLDEGLEERRFLGPEPWLAALRRR